MTVRRWPEQPNQTHAFPAALADQAGPIVSALAMGVMHPAVYTHISVSVGGEQLHIPDRVYYDPGLMALAALKQQYPGSKEQ